GRITCEFKASLGYTVRPCLRKNKKDRQKEKGRKEGRKKERERSTTMPKGVEQTLRFVFVSFPGKTK
ncbi:hypothetical protein GW7_01334, partial [Heterocephalus glaber]